MVGPLHGAVCVGAACVCVCVCMCVLAGCMFAYVSIRRFDCVHEPVAFAG